MVQNMHKMHKSHSIWRPESKIWVGKCFRECKTSCHKTLPTWRPENSYERLGSDIEEEEDCIFCILRLRCYLLGYYSYLCLFRSEIGRYWPPGARPHGDRASAIRSSSVFIAWTVGDVTLVGACALVRAPGDVVASGRLSSKSDRHSAVRIDRASRRRLVAVGRADVWSRRRFACNCANARESKRLDCGCYRLSR
jgi:hypothetical protein